MTSRIRVAQVQDGEAMRQCCLRVCPIDTGPLDHFISILSASPCISHVAINDGDEIVGACLVRLKLGIGHATQAHVTYLMVIPEYQGQGIGRRLLTTSLQSARTESDVSEVSLNVRKSNEPAIRLYMSLKFYATETKPGFYSDGEDAWAMNVLLSGS